jgi:hypothetical protein
VASCILQQQFEEGYWKEFNITLANLHLKKRLPQQRDAGPSPAPIENIMMRDHFCILPEIILSLQDKNPIFAISEFTSFLRSSVSSR